MSNDLKILALSDLHGNLIDCSKYESDVMIIAGDILPLEFQNDILESKFWMLNNFKDWLKKQHTHTVIFIGGNHDKLFQDDPDFMYSEFPKTSNYIYLQDDYVEIDRKKIYGNPWCHIFFNWSFMTTDDELYNIYSKMPKDIDILISHDCPYGLNDVILDSKCYTGKHVGNYPLRLIIEERKPKYCISGHLHTATHNKMLLNKTKCYNVSILNEQYNIAYEPKILYV